MKRFKLQGDTGPVADVATSLGPVYVYRLRTTDLLAFEELLETLPSERMRLFLPNIASLSKAEDGNGERPPLSGDDVQELADEEIDKIASEFARKGVPIAQAESNVARVFDALPDETGADHLHRILSEYVKNRESSISAIKLGATVARSSIFDQMRASAANIGASINAYNRLGQHHRSVEIDSGISSHILAIQRNADRKEKERAEELEIVRLSGKMSAESAKTLKELAEAAATLLEQMDVRDKANGIATKWQIWIAIAALTVSIFLTGLALLQDKSNIESGDVWQAQMLKAIEAANTQRGTTDSEIASLRDEVKVLRSELAAKRTDLEMALPQTRTRSKKQEKQPDIGRE